tara:strand:+ start:14651 stop:16600 length:1950 start_codon:yes stop_codon:yes gene_type:complete
MKFVLCGLSLLFTTFAANLSAEVVVLTDLQGRDVEAEILRIEGQSVRIRRPADGREFVLPLSNLSVDSQLLVKNMEERLKRVSTATITGDWRRLEVEQPGNMDAATVCGMETGGAETRRTTGVYSLHAPIGSWIRAKFETNRGQVETWVRFHGNATHWKFTLDENKVLLSKDGAEPQVVGISLREGEVFEIDFNSDPDRYAQHLCLNAYSDQLQGMAPHLSRFTAFCIRDRNPTAASVRAIAALDPEALGLVVDAEHLPDFAQSAGKKLQALSLVIRNLPPVKDGDRLTTDPITLPSLPSLQYFYVYFALSAPPDFGQTLVNSTPNLRAVYIAVGSPRAKFAEVTELDKLVHLEAVNVPWAIKILPGELIKLPNLKSFRFYSGTLDRSDPDFKSLSKIQGLIHLNNRQDGFAGSVMEEWADLGNLQELLVLETFRAIDFTKLRDVEVLRLRRSSSHHDDFEIKDLGGLNKLWFLKLDLASQDEIDALGALPNASQVEYLFLDRGTFDDLTPLTSMKNLRALSVFKADSMVREVDLSLFPKLERAHLRELNELTSVVGMAGHPSLIEISLNLPKLKTLGPPGGSPVLKAFAMRNMDDITDLKAIQGAANLTSVIFSNCDGLAPPLEIDLDQIDRVYVRGCDSLADRSIGE